MKIHINFIVPICLLICISLSASHAQTISITDGSSIFSFDTEDTEGNANLTGTGPFAADHVYDYLTFVRVGSSNFELNNANTSSIAVTGSGSSQTITYNDVGGNVGLDVTVDFSITTEVSGMPAMSFMGRVSNNTGAAIDADVIMYTDFDFMNTFNNDSASASGDIISITDPSVAETMFFSLVDNSVFEFGTYQGQRNGIRANNDISSNLTPVVNADFTTANKWDFGLIPDGTNDAFIGGITGSPIPEPATSALISGGLISFLFTRRRNKRIFNR